MSIPPKNEQSGGADGPEAPPLSPTDKEIEDDLDDYADLVHNGPRKPDKPAGSESRAGP